MALNFLKRKKNSRKNILLYNDSKVKNQTKYEFSTYVGKNSKSLISEIPDKPISRILRNETKNEKVESNKLENNDVKYEPHTEVFESFDEKSIEEQNWDRGKERINKLMHEIADLLSSENYDNKRYRKMTESNVNKEYPSKEQDSSDNSGSETISNEQKSEHRKLPLNIQELHNVAAMAKRLKARSKLQSNSD